MGKEFNNIEDLFKAKFEDYRIEPSENVWSNINSKLKFRRFIQSGLAKLIGLSVIAGIVIISLTDFNHKPAKKTFRLKENKTTVTIVNSSNKLIEEKTVSKQEIKKIHDKNKHITIQTKDTKQLVDRKDEIVPLILSKSIKLIENKKNQKNQKIELNSKAKPQAIFSLDKKEGCAPFTIHLKNLSKAANAYEWNFGDGHHSKELNPQYTYRYPGTYKITLLVKGLGGMAVGYIDSIVVHEPPKADILWPYNSEILTGQKIKIPNNSESISKVEWNFGDGQKYTGVAGEHIYTQKGTYDIRLKIWSNNGCTDSAVIKNVQVLDINEKIAFPNAFTPNLDGPVSGYYNPSDIYNDVFYPKYKGKIEKYELRIYSRYGVEVFKSNDILYGWNGYYNNRLMPEGVYVYIVQGMFEGNQKFQLKGDVTLLYSKK